MLSVLFNADYIKKPVIKQVFNEPGISYDLYRPADSSDENGKAIFLLHGMIEAGKNDPELVNFAEILSKTGFVVFVPLNKGLSQFQIGHDEVGEARGALQRFNELFPDKRKGVMSFCYSNGVLAAACESDEKLLKKVDFFIFWGSYSSLLDMTLFNLAGYYKAGDKLMYSEPDAVVKGHYLAQKYWYLPYPSGRRERILKAVIKGDPSGLSAAEIKTFRFLRNIDYIKFDKYYSELPGYCREWVEYMAVDKRIKNIKARTIFIHNYFDSLVPYNESEKLFALSGASDKKIYMPAAFQHFNRISAEAFGRISLVKRLKAFIVYYFFTQSVLSA